MDGGELHLRGLERVYQLNTEVRGESKRYLTCSPPANPGLILVIFGCIVAIGKGCGFEKPVCLKMINWMCHKI